MNRKLNWFAADSVLGDHRPCRLARAKALGTTLTAIGAEKAGNAAGTIPAYTAA